MYALTFFFIVCCLLFYMCCPHRSPLPPFWRRYVTLTHCFLYLSFSSRMRMLGFLVGGLVSSILMYTFALFVPVHPPNQAAGHSLDKVTSLSPVFYTLQIPYYCGGWVSVTRLKFTLDLFVLSFHFLLCDGLILSLAFPRMWRPFYAA
jgi:hypothetical protein